jgi:phage-related baseplate assembly protein
MLLQVAAWGEFMPRARVNDAARPIMSPYAISYDTC